MPIETAEPGATASAFDSPGRGNIVAVGTRARGGNERIVRTHFSLFAAPVLPHLRLARSNKFSYVPLHTDLTKREQKRLHSGVAAARQGATNTGQQEKGRNRFQHDVGATGGKRGDHPTQTSGLASRL